MLFSKWTANDYAAWWGAIIASLALIWNIVVAARSGARIHLTALPDMKLPPGVSDKTYIVVTATNRGDTPTTITHFCGYYLLKRKGIFKRRKRQPFIVKTGEFGMSIPHVLSPGEQWSSFSDQAGVRTQLDDGGGGDLYIGIYHSQSSRPCFKRVKLPEPSVC